MTDRKKIWLLLAELWKDAAVDDTGRWAVQIDYWHCYGLCATLSALKTTGLVDEVVAEELKEICHSPMGYRWSILLPEGKQERIQFCLEQAAKVSS